MSTSTSSVRENERQIAERLVEALRGLRFGSLEIVVHDGRVVRLERRERVRLDRDAAAR